MGFLRFDRHPTTVAQSRVDVQDGDHGLEEPRPRLSVTPEIKDDIVEGYQDRDMGQMVKDFEPVSATQRETTAALTVTIIYIPPQPTTLSSGGSEVIKQDASLFTTLHSAPGPQVLEVCEGLGLGHGAP